MAVYFYYGDEDYNIELELAKMRSGLNKDFIAMNNQVLDNPDYSSLVTALRTPPMMFGKMLVVINSENYFLSGKSIFDDKELEDIEDALNNNPEGLDVVFVVRLPREENKKLDTRKKLYKILSKFNMKEFPTIKTYKVSELVSWLNKRGKSKDIILKDDASNLLVEQIGNNLRELDGELDKLKLTAYPEKIVTKKMVEDICISNEDLFNLAELIMLGKKDRALLEFKKLIEKKHPLEILSAIQTMLRKWIIIKTKSGELSPSELAKLTGQHEFVVKQTVTKLKNTTASNLVKLKEKLFKAEYMIKSAESTDIISEVECAIIG